MEYKHVTTKMNYEDLASGKVIESRLGMTSFPVRLGSELFQRGLVHLQKKGVNGPYTVYDPCSGCGYLLTVIGLLHGDQVEAVYASDIREEAVLLSRQNLSLLTIEGIERRIGEIGKYVQEYGKASHKEALEAACRIREGVVQRRNPIPAVSFQADILSEGERASAFCPRADLIITDVPYGQTAQWEGEGEGQDPLHRMLDQLLHLVHPSSVLVLIADKKQKIRHEGYKRLEALKIGKRQAAILERL
ncbi:hypothetical protein [Paenibacillus sp. J2TS4]|uniref:hypothetical protein n=1 Tax=Paenibacillus sp. J2TS4 TaxID=2807194 RepID=UPI001B1D58FD|nr:hypothetical protein [Paenibacillus sp. J2TS4]GIP34399.1 hypothetical protein J2TS4_36090 [Paenibacillus sp. J2TS4]